jgi:hypothetical protein
MAVRKEPAARYWAEASVSVAKTSVFLATAEDSLAKKDMISAAISSYYCLFHLSLSLMWMFPEDVPPTIQEQLIKIRDAGGALPTDDISHKSVENFLCCGQLRFPMPRLCMLFREAQAAREFVNYGPRVTYDGEAPVVGPCSFSPKKTAKIISELETVLKTTLVDVSGHTAYKGCLSPIILHMALDCLNRSDLPFKAWSSEAVLHRSAQVLTDIQDAVRKQNR